MKIGIGSDHTGIKVKELIKLFLLSEFKAEIVDVGAYSEEVVDYPEIAKLLGKMIAEGAVDQGILICGSGIGMSIAANKIHGIRAALCYDTYTAGMARKHNNANIICLGARTDSIELVKEMVKIFLTTPFEGGRHERRVQMLES